MIFRTEESVIAPRCGRFSWEGGRAPSAAPEGTPRRGPHGRARNHERPPDSRSWRIRSTVSVASSILMPASVRRPTAPMIAIIGSDAARLNRRRTQSSRARRSAPPGPPARHHSRNEKMRAFSPSMGDPADSGAIRLQRPRLSRSAGDERQWVKWVRWVKWGRRMRLCGEERRARPVACSGRIRAQPRRRREPT
jgi:hypothetical protein